LVLIHLKLCVVFGSRSFVRQKYLGKVRNISSSQDVLYHGNIIIIVVVVDLITLLSICLLENLHLSQIVDAIKLS